MTTPWSRTGYRLALLALALLIVLHWKIGPILFRFRLVGPLGRSHGVHLGDPLALVPALLALWSTRGRLERRVGVRPPLTPSPGRRAEDRPPARGGPAPQQREPGRVRAARS